MGFTVKGHVIDQVCAILINMTQELTCHELVSWVSLSHPSMRDEIARHLEGTEAFSEWKPAGQTEEPSCVLIPEEEAW